MSVQSVRAYVKNSSVISPVAVVVLTILIGSTFGVALGIMNRNTPVAVVSGAILTVVAVALRDSDADRAREMLPRVHEQANTLTRLMLDYDRAVPHTDDLDVEEFFRVYTDAMQDYQAAAQRPTVRGLTAVQDEFAEAEKMVEYLFEKAGFPSR